MVGTGKLPMKVKRQFYQIYTELEPLHFDGERKTVNTLRAHILQIMAHYHLREYRPRNKWRGNVEEDVIRTFDPEAEIKFGATCASFYVQVSVSDPKELEKLTSDVLTAIANWSQLEAHK